MKKAFTMIELIFVIVILGILAAVALPKFLGVANQAHEANLKGFTGTLNRTVAPTLWSKAISAGKNGDITQLSANDLNLSTYIDVPKEVNSSDINLSNCSSATQYKKVITADTTVTTDAYTILCKNGTSAQAPAFRLVKGDVATQAENNTTCLAGPGCEGQ